MRLAEPATSTWDAASSRDATSRWDAEDDEEAEEKPVKSRWGDDDPGDGAALDEDEKAEKAVEEVSAAREDPANAEEGIRSAEADAPAAGAHDGPEGAQEATTSRKSKRNMLFGCRSKEDFEHLRGIGQGTYGDVSKCALCSQCCSPCSIAQSCNAAVAFQRCLAEFCGVIGARHMCRPAVFFGVGVECCTWHEPGVRHPRGDQISRNSTYDVYRQVDHSSPSAFGHRCWHMQVQSQGDQRGDGNEAHQVRSQLQIRVFPNDFGPRDEHSADDGPPQHCQRV